MEHIENSIYFGFNVNVTKIPDYYYDKNSSLVGNKLEIIKNTNAHNQYINNIRNLIDILRKNEYLSSTTWFIDEYNFNIIDFYDEALDLIVNNYGEIGYYLNIDNDGVINHKRFEATYDKLKYYCSKKNINIHATKLKNEYLDNYISKYMELEKNVVISNNNNGNNDNLLIIEETLPKNIFEKIFRFSKKFKRVPIFIRIDINLENIEDIINNFNNTIFLANKYKINMRTINCREMEIKYFEYYKKNKDWSLVEYKSNYEHLSDSVVTYNIIGDYDLNIEQKNKEIILKYVSDKPFSSSGISFIIKPIILKHIFETCKIILKFYSKSNGNNTLNFFTGKGYITIADLNTEYKYYEKVVDLFLGEGRSVFRFNLNNPKKTAEFYLKNIEFVPYSNSFGSSIFNHNSLINSSTHLSQKESS